MDGPRAALVAQVPDTLPCSIHKSLCAQRACFMFHVLALVALAWAVAQLS